MREQGIELVASYFTISGDVYPSAPSEVSPHALQNRIEAAARAGYKGIGLLLQDLQAAKNQYGMSSIRYMLDEHGMKHIHLEFLVDWYLGGKERVASDKYRHEILTAAQALGAETIKVGPSIQETRQADVPRMADAFAGLCQDAAPYGVNIAFEFLPFSNVSQIDTALAIVEGANQPNGGLLLDIWHIKRGGMGFEEIRKVPLRFIKAVEVNDASSKPLPSLFEDSTHHRRLCGEGDLDVPAFLQAIQEAGYRGPYGVEVLSREFRQRPLEEMARESYDTTMQQFVKITER